MEHRRLLQDPSINGQLAEQNESGTTVLEPLLYAFDAFG